MDIFLLAEGLGREMNFELRISVLNFILKKKITAPLIILGEISVVESRATRI
jgi:hypothetical protein